MSKLGVQKTEVQDIEKTDRSFSENPSDASLSYHNQLPPQRVSQSNKIKLLLFLSLISILFGIATTIFLVKGQSAIQTINSQKFTLQQKLQNLSSQLKSTQQKYESQLKDLSNIIDGVEKQANKTIQKSKQQQKPQQNAVLKEVENIQKSKQQQKPQQNAVLKEVENIQKSKQQQKPQQNAVLKEVENIQKSKQQQKPQQNAVLKEVENIQKSKQQQKPQQNAVLKEVENIQKSKQQQKPQQNAVLKEVENIQKSKQQQKPQQNAVLKEVENIQKSKQQQKPQQNAVLKEVENIQKSKQQQKPQQNAVLKEVENIQKSKQQQKPQQNAVLKEVEGLKKEITRMQENSLSHQNKTKTQENQQRSQLQDLSNKINDLQKEVLQLQTKILNSSQQNSKLLALAINASKQEINRQIHSSDKNQQSNEPSNDGDITQLKQSAQPVLTLPRILWIYTQYKFQSEKMVEQMFGNIIAHRARESGFQVRFANAWSAYEWLSEQTEALVTKTMQNRQIEVSVNEVLKLALLMEHGGVTLIVAEGFPIEGLDWLNEYFKKEAEATQVQNQVLLFSETTKINVKPTFHDYFIAAVPKAAFIVETFDKMCKAIVSEQTRKELNLPILKNTQVNSDYVPDITRNIIHSLLSKKSPKDYATHVIDVDVTIFFRKECRDRLHHWLKRPYSEFIAECGNPVHILHLHNNEDRRKVEDEMENALVTENLGAEKGSYWYELMSIQPNRRLYEPLPPRPIHFCIVDAHPNNDPKLIADSFQKLKLQLFKNYTAVYFVEKQTSENTEYANSQKSKGFNIILPIGTGSVGRNYEVGIIKNCPNKSFVVILKRDESFSSAESLQILSKEMQPRAVLGAYLSLNTSSKVKNVKEIYIDYNKEGYNGRDVRFEDLTQIVNHLRVFHSDCYKIIPQFDLRKPQGQYFNDRFNFQEHFLYMVRNRTGKHQFPQVQHTQRVKWYVKSNSHIFDVPNRILDIRNIVVNTLLWDEVDRGELTYFRYTFSPFAMTYNMDHLVQAGIPMQEFAVFNPGNQYEPYTERNKPQLIPKVFHSIWIEGNMPEAKQKALQINKQIYSDYEFKLWTKKDITREKFPLSYDLLNTLYNMESSSRYSKRATMADVMRHEILYNQGGIYTDSNMLLFNKVFDKWLSYQFVLPTEATFRHRWSQNMCIFAVMPKFPGLKRIIMPNNTNHYNIYLRDATNIAGPYSFKWMMRGMQEYDPDYLIMSYVTFYPLGYTLPQPWEDYCFQQLRYQDPSDEVFYVSGNRRLIKNCGKYYPASYGKELSSLGSGSWLFPKW